MTNKDKNELLRLLEVFFAENQLNQRDFINKNKIASLLKKQMIKLGRWKNLPRGSKKAKIGSTQDFAMQFLAKQTPSTKNSDECPF